MPTVKFVNEKKTIEVPEGANLRKVAYENGIDVYRGIHRVLHCPGWGVCTTCKVLIRKGADNASPQGRWERLNLLKAIFARIGREKELRLSCQTEVHGDIDVETHPPFNWHGDKFWG